MHTKPKAKTKIIFTGTSNHQYGSSVLKATFSSMNHHIWTAKSCNFPPLQRPSWENSRLNFQHFPCIYIKKKLHK